MSSSRQSVHENYVHVADHLVMHGRVFNELGTNIRYLGASEVHYGPGFGVLVRPRIAGHHMNLRRNLTLHWQMVFHRLERKTKLSGLNSLRGARHWSAYLPSALAVAVC